MIISTKNIKSFITLFYCISILFVLSCKSKTVIAKPDIDSKDFTLKDVSYAKKNIYVGELNEEQLQLFKTYFQENLNQNIDSLKYISISYLKPRSKCWYDNYSYLSSSKFEKSISNSRSKMNSKLFLLHAEDKAPTSLSHFDKNQFIYKLFDKGIEACDFSLTIDTKGHFLFKAGHFDLKVLNAFKNELEKFNITITY